MGGFGTDLEAAEVPQFGQRAAVHRPAGPDQGDPIAEGLDLGQDVTRQQDGAPTPPLLFDASLELGFLERIQAGRRFVQQEQFGVGGQGGDQCDLLPVAFE